MPDAPELILDDDDRYESLRLIPWWRQERLAAAKVLVVGAGALGNEVLKNLALIGVGQIQVIDFDRVEAGNLARSVFFRLEDAGRPKAEVAVQRASELNPEVRFEAIVGDVIYDLGLGAFRAADVVIGCLDNREARLWVNRQCWKAGTPWVDAGIQEIQGVVKVFVPPDSACYECAMTSRDYELLNRRYSCPMLRRDEILEGKVPTAPTIASMMAALQVQEALKLLHGLPVEAGSALVFNGVGNQFYKTRLPRRDDCLSHETYPDPVAIDLRVDDTANSLFDRARESLGGPLELVLERDLAVALACPACGTREEIDMPRGRLGQSRARCEACRGDRLPEVVDRVAEGSPLADRRLRELGVPAFDIVQVRDPRASGFYLLEAARAGEAGP